MWRYLSVFLLTVLQFAQAHAATFTVSNAADSGAGTLREALALAAANGANEKDYIHFGAGIIEINLLSPLILSSELVIDGTSRPGAVLGVSDAKINIRYRGSHASGTVVIGFSGENLKNVEVYGVFFSDFTSHSRGGMPIYIRSSTDIVIGAASKGNVFHMADINLYLYKCNRIKIAANLFSTNAEMTRPTELIAGTTLFDLGLCDNIIIGGDTKADGNKSSYTHNGMMITGANPGTGLTDGVGEFCKIKNNVFGIESLNVGVSNPHAIRKFKKIELTNNLSIMGGGFDFQDITESGILQGNKIGVTENLSKSYSYTILYLTRCNNFLIGGENPGEENVLANGPGILATNCGNVSLRKNSIYCTTEVYASDKMYMSFNSVVELPKIAVSSYVNGLVTGTATPNSKIELFADSECMRCDAKTFLGSTNADAGGNWSANINRTIGFTASATYNDRTSLFLDMSLQVSGAKIKNTSCGLANGSITGIVVDGATVYEWRNEDNVVVANTLDIYDLKAGKYTFMAYRGSDCKTKSATYVVKNGQPELNVSAISVGAATCAQENGFIKGITFKNASDFSLKSLVWLNEKDEVKGNVLSLQDAGPGSYRLKVTTSDDCVVEYGPVIITSIGAPVIDISQVIITGSSCLLPNGSIKNITATGTGTISYVWKDESGVIVGNDPELSGKAGGKYILEVKDNGVCGPATVEFSIPEINGVTISDAQVMISSASCSLDNGSIKNVNVYSDAGNLNYKWFNELNQMVSTAADLINVSPGSYYLIASNGTCSKQSKTYVVERQQAIAFPEFAYTINPASCGADNGSIAVDPGAFANDIRLRWLNNQGQTIGDKQQLFSLSEGIYNLYITDRNGCENLYKSYTVNRINSLNYDLAGVVFTPDRCDKSVGAITNVRISGGVPPYTYEWRDNSNKVIATQPDLVNVISGNYTLHVTDNSSTNCNNVALPFLVSNVSEIVPAPVVEPVNICSAGDVVITVRSTTHSVFKLYNSMNSVVPVTSNSTGVFKTTITENSTLFVSIVNGTCESQRVPVPFHFVEKAIGVNSSFTPNNDGLNDTWTIRSIENYPTAQIKIFNRDGNVVYQSEGYNQPFDGRRNGSDLPVGVYYYIIDLQRDCRQISGSLTLLR